MRVKAATLDLSSSRSLPTMPSPFGPVFANRAIDSDRADHGFSLSPLPTLDQPIRNNWPASFFEDALRRSDA